MLYPVVIHKDPDSDYGATVPDLPGCFSAGDSTEEALGNVSEAIECHIEGILIDGEELPAPRCIEEHQKNPDFADGLWAVVNVDLSKLSGKARRINVTIPELILHKVDAFATSSGESRSGILTSAVVEYLCTHGPSTRKEPPEPKKKRSKKPQVTI